jgi:hypothetical protein
MQVGFFGKIGSIVVVLMLTMVAAYADTLSVDIDIKPWSCPNAVNLRSRGVVPVAVLSTSTFDATTVNPSTVTFGPGAASPTTGGHIEDVNLDGLLDIVFHFKVGSCGFYSGLTGANLWGQTYGGTVINGYDSLKIIG